MKIGLVQVLGSDPTPSLVAVLAFQPVAVANISLKDSASDSRRLAEAASAAGHAPRFAHLQTDAAWSMPRIRDLVIEAIRSIRCDPNVTIVVQLTGAHEVSFAAALEAARLERVVAISLDLPFDDADGIPQAIVLSEEGVGTRDTLACFRPRLERLRLEAVAHLHGYGMTEGAEWRGLTRFARAALEDVEAEEELHRCLPESGGSKSPWPGDHAWSEWTQPMQLPERLASLAEECGLLERVRGGHRVVDPGPSLPPDRRRARVERSMSLLRGGWVEVALAEAMSLQDRFRDVRWSIEAEAPRPMEHDVLALKGSSLVLASAKRSMQPGMFGHVREIRAHANRLGGSRAIAALCVGRLDPSRLNDERRSLAEDLREVCDAIGVRLVGRRELLERRFEGF